MTSFKVIIPKPLQVNAMVNVLIKETEKLGKDMVKDFNSTTRTWQGDKPVFKATMKMDNRTNNGWPNRIILTVAPGNNDKGAEVWQYLNKGTKVRYAVMSKDFKAKTRPGLLKSYAGKGKMLFVNKKIKRPGIKARKWDERLYDKYRNILSEQMYKVEEDMAKASGHGG